ncbi:hypothetical protein ACFPN7_14645 [Amycolatopsis halotolerans]
MTAPARNRAPRPAAHSAVARASAGIPLGEWGEEHLERIEALP